MDTFQVSAMAPRTGEQQVGRTARGIPIVLDCHAAERVVPAQRRALAGDYRRIMALPAGERRRAWTALSPVLGQFADNEASWKALEQLYTRDDVRFGALVGVDDGGVARRWFATIANAVAVRERGRATTALVRAAIAARLRYGGAEVRVASIAAGSARCVLEAVHGLPAALLLRVSLLDHDPAAAAYSRQLATTLGVGARVETIVGNAVRAGRHFPPRSLDVAEVVGLLDYLADGLLVTFLRQMRRLLADGGVLVASNILDNVEREFVHTAVGWRAMHYRTEEAFVDLFVAAGFRPSDLTVHRLPGGVYALVEATAGAH